MTENQNGKFSAKKRTVYIVIAALMGITTVACILLAISLGDTFGEIKYLHIMISVLGMVFALTLFLGCCFTFRENTRQGRALAGASALIYINILLSGIFDLLDGAAEIRRLLLILQNVTSLISTLTHFLIWRYQRASLPKTHTRKIYTVLIYGDLLLYLVLLIVNLFTPILFYVDASGYTNYPGEVFEIVNGFVFYGLYLLYVLTQRCSLRKKLSVASFAFFPLLYCAFSVVWYAFGMTYSILSTWYIFLLLAAYMVFFGDYIESRELLLRQKAELAEQARKQTELQTTLMLSQVRPHFLYNALTAIRNLCKNDPAEAYTALGSFADYLRSNMDFLGGGRLIPFVKELEHIRTYLELEQLRFGDELRVEYDIEYEDFSLPALTVQPLVENAVRHGAVMNEGGGIVTVRTEKTESGVRIRVSDNGPGFDPAVMPSDGKTHYGLLNVRACLAATGCGELMIDSAPGAGTTVTIAIREGNDENSAC